VEEFDGVLLMPQQHLSRTEEITLLLIALYLITVSILPDYIYKQTSSNSIKKRVASLDKNCQEN
jgi:hypothetical protein